MNVYRPSASSRLLLRSAPDCQRRTYELQITATYLLTQFVSEALQTQHEQSYRAKRRLITAFCL